MIIYLILLPFLPLANGYPNFNHNQPNSNSMEEFYPYYDLSENHIDEPMTTTSIPILADGITPEPTLSSGDEYLRRVPPQKQFEALLFSYQAGLLIQYHENLKAGIPSKTHGGPNGTDCIKEQKARRVEICPIRCIFDFDDWFPVAGCGPTELKSDTIKYMCCPPWVKIETPEPEEEAEPELQ